MRCEEIRDLAPEIALGIADGAQRAEALRHLSTCRACQRVVEQLSQVADELLVLAPTEEPPAGFESRVVRALEPERPPSRRRARWWSPRWLLPRLGPAVAAAAVTAAALISVYSDDREVADRYRDTLALADGRYFQAERLTDGTGSESGVVFGYDGNPSWLLVTVDAAHRNAVTRGELLTTDHRRIPLPPLELDRRGSWGAAVPVDLSEVASVRLLGERPGQVLQASIARAAPWD
jgi:Putative zinc-finger